MNKIARLQKRETVTIGCREPRVIVPMSIWRKAEELLEDQEALASRRYRQRIQRARVDAARGRLVRPFGIGYADRIRAAWRAWRKLPDHIQNRLQQKLREYARDPLRHAVKLSDRAIGTCRFNVGDYQIVFDIAGEQVLIPCSRTP